MEKTALSEHSASLLITGPIVDLIINPDAAKTGDGCSHQKQVQDVVGASRNFARDERRDQQTAMEETGKSLKENSSSRQRLLIDTAGEKGVSSWLTVHPSLTFGTVLNKSDFQDAVCLRAVRLRI